MAFFNRFVFSGAQVWSAVTYFYQRGKQVNVEHHNFYNPFAKTLVALAF